MRLIPVLVGIVGLLIQAAPAGGNVTGLPNCEKYVLSEKGGLVCVDRVRVSVPGYQPPKPPFSSKRVSTGPVLKTVRIPAIEVRPEVGWCWRPGPTRIPEAEYRADPQFAVWEKLTTAFPRCPATVPEAADPEEVVIDVLEEFPLPAPKPYIAPGRAITGLRAFLEPNLEATTSAGKPAYTGIRQTPLGDMQVDATAVYYVDWGDKVTGPHPGPGGPWPNGNISHVYTEMGPVDVNVTAEWSVQWRVGTTTGTLTVPTEGTIEDFPVGQLQAVRNY